MKKMLCVLLILILILGCVFIWKGGHHALILWDALSEWIDEDAADQGLILQLSVPGVTVEGADDAIMPVVRQMSLTADAFWTEYANKRVYGLSAEGYSAYLCDGTLYMDTGRAYRLPDTTTLEKPLRDFAAGLLLYGRVEQIERGYRVTMEREELTFCASFTVNGDDISSVSVNLNTTMDGQPVCLTAVVTPKEPSAHPLPRAVTDAMVLAQMARPMLITEPLEVLLPALENAFPLEAEVKFGVERGILTISDTAGLSVSDGKASLIRKGQEHPLDLPDTLTDVDPMTIGLLMLRNGEFTQEGDTARFALTLPAEATAELVTQLVPQAANLGLTFEKSEAVLTINGEKLTSVTLGADGSVPFLVTSIPLSFRAEFNIQ